MVLQSNSKKAANTGLKGENNPAPVLIA